MDYSTTIFESTQQLLKIPSKYKGVAALLLLVLQSSNIIISTSAAELSFYEDNECKKPTTNLEIVGHTSEWSDPVAAWYKIKLELGGDYKEDEAQIPFEVGFCNEDFKLEAKYKMEYEDHYPTARRVDPWEREYKGIMGRYCSWNGYSQVTLFESGVSKCQWHAKYENDDDGSVTSAKTSKWEITTTGGVCTQFTDKEYVLIKCGPSPGAWIGIIIGIVALVALVIAIIGLALHSRSTTTKTSEKAVYHDTGNSQQQQQQQQQQPVYQQQPQAQVYQQQPQAQMIPMAQQHQQDV